MSVKIISRTALENARQRLRELPKLEPKQRDKFTVTEALKDLGPEIREGMKKGYTLAQIHEQLEAIGVGIALNTLRTAKLRRTRRRVAPEAKDIGEPKDIVKASAPTNDSAEAKGMKPAAPVYPDAKPVSKAAAGKTR